MPRLTGLLLTAALLMLCSSSFSQSLKGVARDTAGNKNINNAVVALLTPVDSFLYKFVRTDAQGGFEVKNVKPGKYIMLITHPYFANYVEDIDVPQAGLDMKQIAFITKSQLLQEVIVKSGSPIKIKGDTTEYTADSFRVQANANVEELLKRLPGMQVDKDGTIKAMGEKVTKVLVDGEEFFGDDPGIAVKNLRADAVDKVQVFDKKSDQATFTGIDDGVKDKTINLKLKEDKKRGYFGKISAGGGLPSNYNNSAMINAFKAKRKIAAYGIMSNTGQTNLDWQDQNNYGGGMGDNMQVEDNGDIYFFGGGDDYYNNRNGIPRNWNGGVHYSDKFNDNKISLNTGYKYSKINSLGNTSVYSKIFLPDTSWNTNSTSRNYTSKVKHGINFTYDVMLDSSNSIKLISKFNSANTETSSDYYTESINNKGSFINNSNRKTTNEQDNNSMTGTLLWKHKFKKKSRTLSINIDGNWSEAKNNGFLFARNNYYDAGSLVRTDTIDQKNTRDNTASGIVSKIAYTEPLFKDAYMEVNYTYSTAKNTTNRVSSVKDPTGKYLDEVDSLTNRYDFNQYSNKPGMNFRYNHKKINTSIGSSVSFNRFVQKNRSNNDRYSYDFTNYFPTASFNYKIKGNENIRFNYNGSATAPKLEQLQPIKDNTDPLNVYEGNPDLKQSFRHSVNLNYNFYNVLKKRGMWSGIWASTTNNAFVQSSSIDSLGRRRYKTVNASGIYNANLYGNYNMEIGKGYGIEIGTELGKSRNIDFVNSVKNDNRTSSYEISAGIRKYKENKYNFSVRPSYTFNHSTSSLNAAANIDYWQIGGWADGGVTLPWKIEIRTDVRVEVRQKDPRFPANNNYTLWNASINRKFMDNKLEFDFGVNDILSQNRGFDRNFTSSSFTETYYNTLKRYFMFTITYNFSTNGAKPSGF